MNQTLFLKLLQYLQENMCVGVPSKRVPATLLTRKSKQVFSCQYWEIFKKTNLENICERLLLQFLVKMYLLYVNSMGAEGRRTCI